MPRTRHDKFPAVPLPDVLDGDRGKGEQLREALEAVIREQGPGSLLPSERSIAERFGVARTTVRHEIGKLVTRGLVRRVKGAGTFVTEPKLAHGTTTGSFSHDMRARGMVPGARVISVRERPASAPLAERLGIAEGDPVAGINRLRTADGVPMALEHTYLPANRFPGIVGFVHDDQSLYDVLSDRWAVTIERATHRVSVIALDETDAALLDVPLGLPSFLVERTAYDTSGAVVEWGRSRYRGDRYDVIFDVHPT